MATHSSVLAWRIPGTGEPSGLPSLGLHRVGHDSSDFAAAVQWLRLCLPVHGATGSIPGWGTKISHARGSRAKKVTHKNYNHFMPYNSLCWAGLSLLRGVLTELPLLFVASLLRVRGSTWANSQDWHW